MSVRLTKREVGKRCVFHGFDGKDYKGVIKDVSHGVVMVHYVVSYLPPERRSMAYIDQKAYPDRVCLLSEWGALRAVHGRHGEEGQS